MRKKHQSHVRFALQLCGGAALFSILAMPVAVDFAFAQEAAIRSGLDPQSPLATSPLDKAAKKKLRRKGTATPLASNSQNVYQTDTVSEQDPNNDAQLKLYGGDTTDTESNSENASENGTGQKPNTKPKRTLTALSEMVQEEDDLDALPGGKTASTKDKKTANAKSKKTGKTVKTSGKTAINPALDEQSTGSLVVRKGQKAQMLRAQPELAEQAVQSRDLTEEANPYKAVGIRFGSITLRPAIEQGLEVTTNSTASTGGAAATNSVTTFRVDGISDWRNGSLETTGFVTLRKALSGASELDVESGASFTLTQPILREWNYTIGGAYGLKRESAVSGSSFPTTIATRPLAQNIRLSLGVGNGEGVFQPSFKVELDRLTYGDATDSLGAAISQSDRDQTALRGTFRLGTEVSSSFIPFVELAYGKTWRDDAVDVFGNDRTSSDLRISVGTKINPSEKLNGEVSVGWLRQTFDNSALSDIDGLALAAALNWSPQNGTMVTAGLTTNAEPANSATVSGSMVYAATLGLTHQLSERFSTSASLGASYRDFTDAGGNDTTLSAELAATYWINRMLGVNAKVRHEAVSSSDPLRESDTTTLLLGLKIQR